MSVAFSVKRAPVLRRFSLNDFPISAALMRSRTKRLQEALRQLGLIAGGQVGADLGCELGMSGSRDTILRLVRQSEQSARPELHVIGLDDWAWKRRQRYGNLICDLERGLPIDLLPDRAVETVEAWLRAHPSIDVVCRDGSSEYASAISKGAPQARQVSERWHLVKNLAACVSVQLARSLTQIRRAGHTATTTYEEVQLSREQYSHPRTRAERRTHQVRQDERLARYEHITALFKQGMKSTDIAIQIGMTERTVRRWLSRGGIPYAGPRKPRPRLIDPYKSYLLSRWHQGCHNGAQLESELRAKGYEGSQRAIYRYLETLEPSGFSPRRHGFVSAPQQTASEGEPNPLLTLSAQQATWLFFCRPEDLKEKELQRLQLLRQASPHLETVYQLVEKFLHMVRQRTGEQLTAWLAFVEASHLEAFDSFVTGVQQDRDAVLAGLTLPWNNGPLEGNVNRLKLMKRSMYGRAELDLLKLRVLHQSKRSQDRKNKKSNHPKPQVGPLKEPKIVKSGTNFQHTTTGISKVA